MDHRDIEESVLAELRSGHKRLVRNRKRKRLLEKRGEDIKWCPYALGWIWTKKI